MNYILDRKAIEWAFEKRCEGHPMHQIADALFVNEKTVERALKRTYGRTSPDVLKALVYEGYR